MPVVLPQVIDRHVGLRRHARLRFVASDLIAATLARSRDQSVAIATSVQR